MHFRPRFTDPKVEAASRIFISCQCEKSGVSDEFGMNSTSKSLFQNLGKGHVTLLCHLKNHRGKPDWPTSVRPSETGSRMVEV